MNTKDTTWIKKACAGKNETREYMKQSWRVEIDGTIYAVGCDGIRAHYTKAGVTDGIRCDNDKYEAALEKLPYRLEHAGLVSITLDRQAMINAVERANVVVKNTRQIGIVLRVVGTGTLEIKAKDIDEMSISTLLGVVYNGSPVHAEGKYQTEIAIDPAYLLQALNGMASQDVTLWETDKGYEHIMLTDDGRQHIAIIKPLDDSAISQLDRSYTIPAQDGEVWREAKPVKVKGISSGEVLSPVYAALRANLPVPAPAPIVGAIIETPAPEPVAIPEPAPAPVEVAPAPAPVREVVWLEFNGTVISHTNPVTIKKLSANGWRVVPEPTPEIVEVAPVIAAPAPVEVVAPEPTPDPVKVTAPAYTVKMQGALSWVAFDAKPDEMTRSALKSQGFRWSSKRAAWYHTGGAVPVLDANIGDAIMQEIAKRFAVPALPAQCPICLPASMSDWAVEVAAPLTLTPDEVMTLTSIPMMSDAPATVCAAEAPDRGKIIMLDDYRKPEPPAPAPIAAPDFTPEEVAGYAELDRQLEALAEKIVAKQEAPTDKPGKHPNTFIDSMGAEYWQHSSGDRFSRSYMPSGAAIHIRKALKAAFPGVKFSVTSDRYSVRVVVPEGVDIKAVERIANQYEGLKFDGMIDLQYNARTWMMPDGTIVGNSTPGTEGGRGSCPAVRFTPPDGAIECDFYAYVFVDRA